MKTKLFLLFFSFFWGVFVNVASGTQSNVPSLPAKIFTTKNTGSVIPSNQILDVTASGHHYFTALGYDSNNLYIATIRQNLKRTGGLIRIPAP